MVTLKSHDSCSIRERCGGHVDLAMLLIERGANIEEVNDEGYTPLMEAAREGHDEMVSLLLTQGSCDENDFSV
jgi:ankyrin repeat protein